jgi:hypothetical protein
VVEQPSTMSQHIFILVIFILNSVTSLENQNDKVFHSQTNLIQEICPDHKNATTLTTTTAATTVSRQRRSFGGVEPTDFRKAFIAIFGVPGWLTQGLEAFSDINFHLLGYTTLGNCC